MWAQRPFFRYDRVPRGTAGQESVRTGHSYMCLKPAPERQAQEAPELQGSRGSLCLLLCKVLCFISTRRESEEGEQVMMMRKNRKRRGKEGRGRGRRERRGGTGGRREPRRKLMAPESWKQPQQVARAGSACLPRVRGAPRGPQNLCAAGCLLPCRRRDRRVP